MNGARKQGRKTDRKAMLMDTSRTLFLHPRSQAGIGGYELTAKQYLNRARHLDTEIEVLLKAKQAAYEAVTRITQNYEGDVTTGTKDPHKYDRIAELIDIIDRKTDEYVDTLEEIVQTIMKVEDDRQRNVLTLYYTAKDPKTGKPLTWEQVAVELHYSWKQTRRIHGRALISIDSILGERCP